VEINKSTFIYRRRSNCYQHAARFDIPSSRIEQGVWKELGNLGRDQAVIDPVVCIGSEGKERDGVLAKLLGFSIVVIDTRLPDVS
jgi:hypothetical protein